MNRFIRIVCLMLLGLCALPLQAMNDEQTMREMIGRLLPEHSADIVVKKMQVANGKDFFQLETVDGKLVISGNNANSMAVGLNHYLKYYCKTSVSWYTLDRVQMPEELPVVKDKYRSEARCSNRFFLNYCTFGYTMPWWTWEDWERLIDWMALNGVNMPLAITGQEYVWYKVWKKMGLSDQEIRNYFTGPAHLPWHRMSNLDYWQGNLPMEWLEEQKKLQQRILERERSFNMRPVSPAFAGHVPQELKRIYPEAKISQMSSWGGFADQYRSHFLDPLDPLFAKIQEAFLAEQIALFGTDHIYGADPFNEVMPPSWEPEFLANCSKHIFESISNVDEEATWLQMTWLFYIDRKLWTNERVQAFLKAVPQDRLLLLDYYCENTEVWKLTDSYFGQPYLWCYLGNFGGNTMLAGNVKEVGSRIDHVLKQGGQNLWGLGATLEGFGVNEFVYEYIFEKAWTGMKSDKDWMEALADRHLGKADKSFRKAWQLLYEDIYVAPSALGQGTLTNARPSLEGHGNWTTNPEIAYSNKTLLDIWQLMLSATKHDRTGYQYDVVNIARQTMSNYFMQLRDDFAQSYKDKDIEQLRLKAAQMKELLQDLDVLLATQSSFLLGKWVDDARSWGHTAEEKDYYERNAKTLISTWGDRNQSLNDYGNRSWAGLTIGYYLPRWTMFTDRVIEAVETGKEFDENCFLEDVTAFEIDWAASKAYYSVYPVGNPYEVAKDMYQKYEPMIKNE